MQFDYGRCPVYFENVDQFEVTEFSPEKVLKLTDT